MLKNEGAHLTKATVNIKLIIFFYPYNRMITSIFFTKISNKNKKINKTFMIKMTKFFPSKMQTNSQKPFKEHVLPK